MAHTWKHHMLFKCISIFAVPLTCTEFYLLAQYNNMLHLESEIQRYKGTNCYCNYHTNIGGPKVVQDVRHLRICTKLALEPGKDSPTPPKLIVLPYFLEFEHRRVLGNIPVCFPDTGTCIVSGV